MASRKCIAILILTVFFVLSPAADEHPTVTISTGKLKGSTYLSTNGRPFDAYVGIPYAEPPTDQLRFKPPEPAKPWTGILDATTDGSACPQPQMTTNSTHYDVTGDEHCLFVNVYKPRTDRRLAVLVFVHGGAFYLGTGSMSVLPPNNFMDEDIILVTMNYRLGVLGFLCTEDENAFGNYGLLDQVLALRWVQRNVQYFGGDPHRVTVSGFSAGAVSVALLVLSPLAKGLFRAAIAQSGTSLNYWSIQENPLFWAKKIAEEVNCPTNGSRRETVNCLRATTANDLVLALTSLQVALAFPQAMLPVVEMAGGSGFLVEHPLVLLEEDKIESRVPILTGVVKDEGLIFAYWMQTSFKTKGEEFFDDEFPTRYLKYMVPVKPPIELRLKTISKAIQKEYFRTEQDLNNPRAFLERYSEFLDDVMFFVGLAGTLRWMSNAGIEAYAYKYTYYAQLSSAMMSFGSAAINMNLNGHVLHGDDDTVQFAPASIYVNESINNATIMREILNHMWSNFVNTLKPSFVGTPIEDQSLMWPPFDALEPNYLELNLNPVMREGDVTNRMKFWMETVRSLANDDLNKNNLTR